MNALKAFEAAARSGSFTAAGRELGVTSAAISQLVRKLERHLGKRLFSRSNNKLTLTDAGTAVFTRVTPALNEIAEAVLRVKRDARKRKLVVSVIGSVAECWLLPALPRFLNLYPRTQLDIRIEDAQACLSNSDVDISIGYGNNSSPEAIVQELYRDEALPLCAPSYLQSKGGSLHFQGVSQDLIHTHWGDDYGTNPTWKDWFSAYVPGPAPDLASGHRVNATRTALQLAKSGCGIALGHRKLAAESIRDGTLVAPINASLRLGQSHHIAYLPSKSRLTDLVIFRDWLLQEVRTER